MWNSMLITNGVQNMTRFQELARQTLATLFFRVGVGLMRGKHAMRDWFMKIVDLADWVTAIVSIQRMDGRNSGATPLNIIC